MFLNTCISLDISDACLTWPAATISKCFVSHKTERDEAFSAVYLADTLSISYHKYWINISFQQPVKHQRAIRLHSEALGIAFMLQLCLKAYNLEWIWLHGASLSGSEDYNKRRER